MRARQSCLLAFPMLLVAGGCVANGGAGSSTEPAAEQDSPAAADEAAPSKILANGQRSSAPAAPSLHGQLTEATTTVQPSGLPATFSNDACAGAEAITLDLVNSPTAVISGTTVGASDDYTGWCSDPGGPDRVYELTLVQDGVLSLAVSGSNGLVPTMTIRNADCEQGDWWDYCLDTSQWDGRLPTQAFAAGTYWIIIDSEDGTAGDYNFSARLNGHSCSDGIISGTEQCDDTNEASGDGCFDCQFESAPASLDQCDGDQYALSAGALNALSLSGTNTGYTDDYSGSCSWDVGGRDRVFHIVPQSSGTMTARVGDDAFGNSACVTQSSKSCWDHVLYIRKGSCASTDPLDELGCSDSNDWTATEQVSAEVTAGADYWVIVDGYDAAGYSFGDFIIEVALQ